MGKDTHIQWCDSTQNAQMGCEGCELVKGQEVNKCYAKTLTDRYAGRKGWPEAFNKPKIFWERIPPMVNWPDLTGKERLDKPWLNGYPRIVFLNDMGDTFSGGMLTDWFSFVIPKIENSPHQYLVLSKWPNRFAAFSHKYLLSPNIWAGTSLEGKKTLFRIEMLRYVNAGIKFLSIEPLWEDIHRIDLSGINWVIIGGESGPRPTPCEFDWIKNLVDKCREQNVQVFVKQMGSFIAKREGYQDKSGGDWNEWPQNLKVRQMPILW